MPYISHHVPGAFCWIELSTSDQNAAKHFYGSLFGWTFSDSPVGPNDFYTTFLLEGQNAAAAYTIREDETALGIPPHWNLYMNVESADAAAGKAAGLGGTVLYGPFDVSTYGRMAVVADPTGAVFHVWEAKSHPGIGVMSQPASFCWADLSTPDQAVAAKFYAGLFGYTMPPGEGGYLHLKNGDDFIGGIPPSHQRDPHTPPHWLIYLQVENCAASTEKARALGASVYFGPMEIPKAGIMTVLADPQGASFALFQPTFAAT